MSLGVLERLEAELSVQRRQLEAALARIAALEATPSTAASAERLLSAGEAAKVARMRRSAVVGAIIAGELRGTINEHRAGKSAKYRIAPSDLDRWLRSRGTNG